MRRLLLGAKCRQDQGEVYGSTSTNPRPLRWWQAEIWGPNQACKHVSSSGKFSSFHRSSAGFTSSQSKINHSSPSLFSDLCMTSTCSEKPAPSSRTPLMSYIRLSNGFISLYVLCVCSVYYACQKSLHRDKYFFVFRKRHNNKCVDADFQDI